MRGAGVVLHTVGLGEDADAALLVALAGDPGRYHAAPSPADLRAIYLTLAGGLLCDPGDYWGHRCR